MFPTNAHGHSQLIDLARVLRELHENSEVVVAPNAWDAASARVLADVGYATIATTSAGVAWSAGYPDGQAISFAEMITAVARIAAAVPVPVSADLEAGYTEETGDIEQTVGQLLAAGAVGINLEDGDSNGDGLIDAEAHAAVIRRARATADDHGVPLFINARTDVFWRQLGEERQRVDAAADRLNLYAEAGSDCLFAPGAITAEQLGDLARRVVKPLNVMLMPGVPDLPELAALGVRRVSIGADLFLCALAATADAATRLRRGDTSALFEGFSSTVLATMARMS